MNDKENNEKQTWPVCRWTISRMLADDKLAVVHKMVRHKIATRMRWQGLRVERRDGIDDRAHRR